MPIRLLICVLSVVLLAASSLPGARLPKGVKAAYFVNDNPPYPESHASTIVEVGKGHLVAAWFGGTKERAPDVSIWVAHFENNRWSEAVEVADGRQSNGPRLPTWNPVLFNPPGGPLVLFYKVGPSPSEWWGMMRTSDDGGRSWSVARTLPEGILGPIKNKPVLLDDGTWLCGSSTEGTPDGWLAHFEMTHDRGATWEKTASVDKGPGLDAIQPSILFHADGRLEALCRTKQGTVAMTWSADRGRTWSGLAATELPNPNSGTDALTLKDGRQLIVYNHSGHRPDEPGKGNRWPLDVAISSDGITWNRIVTLETEPMVSGYSYPAVIQASDGLVHITYTWGRKKIKHVILKPSSLR
ncbi:MAG: exo-alpha-sialidase [Opitutaceae bacterium]|nr:exo-alpha-sialidase [Opitutaceae bacterium]